jgi:hypothetical protein
MVDAPPDMKVRLTSGLRAQIEAAARANRRTLNGEIVARLEASFSIAEAHLRRDLDALGIDLTAIEDTFRSILKEHDARLTALEAKAK